MGTYGGMATYVDKDLTVKVTLEKVRDCLRAGAPVVTVAPEIAVPAKRAIDAMLAAIETVQKG